jgi:hypothetical protein
MKLNSLILAGSLALTGCPKATANPPKYEPGRIHERSAPISDHEKYLALKPEESKFDKAFRDAAEGDESYKLGRCIEKNSELFKQYYDQFLRMTSALEFHACAKSSMPSQEEQDCKINMLERQEKYADLSRLIEISVAFEKKVLDCISETKWDPVITQWDITGALMANHPDPDIRVLMDRLIMLEDEARKMRELRGKKSWEKLYKLCVETPEWVKCGDDSENAWINFAHKLDKKSYIDSLRKKIEWESVKKACFEKKAGK